MKKILTAFFLLVFVSKTFALGDKFKLGLMVSPGLAWYTPQGKDLTMGAVGFGMNYGLQFEYYFKPNNYAFVTGVFGGMEAGQIKSRDAFSLLTSGKNVTEKYFNHNVQIPLAIKLKTNNIKSSKFRIYGQVGFTNVINVSSRATFDQTLVVGSTDVVVDKENMLRNGNEVQKAIPGFKMNFYDLRLDLGAGIEMDLDAKTSMLFGVQFQNGFLNQIKDNDAKNEPINMRNFNFKVGVIF